VGGTVYFLLGNHLLPPLSCGSATQRNLSVVADSNGIIDMTKSLKLFSLIILTIFLSGCYGNGYLPVPPTTLPLKTVSNNFSVFTPTPPEPNVDEMPKKTNEIRPSPTIPSSQLYEQDLPDLLLNLSKGSKDTCNTDYHDEIVLVESPYTSSLKFLSNGATDYLHSKWSPDGKWIAFISSNPSVQRERSNESVKNALERVQGKDEIWITNVDDSIKKKISESLPSGYFTHMMGKSLGCDLLASIVSFQWSIDSRFVWIIYATLSSENISGWKYSYYISEVSTGKTRLVLTNFVGDDIFWSSVDNLFIIKTSSNELVRVNVVNIDEISTKTIDVFFPDKVSENVRFSLLSVDESYYYLTFTSPDGKQKTIWKYEKEDVLAHSQLVETWTNSKIYLVNKTVLQCDETTGRIDFYQLENWKSIGYINLGEGFDYSCVFHQIKDAYGEYWLLFTGQTNLEGPGVWAIPINITLFTKPLFLVNYWLVTDHPDSIYDFDVRSKSR
jgi:hypothetical protein